MRKQPLLLLYHTSANFRRLYVYTKKNATTIICGKGHCDYIFIPKKKGIPAIILELKYGHSCEEALQQIKDRNYIQRVKEYGEILLVGINYDAVKHHTCRIEKIIADQ